jgi:ferritin
MLTERLLIMISKKMEKAINEQINAEMYSAYLYLSMKAYFESINLKGFANWMDVQDKEETFHAMKFYAYVADRGGRVKLTGIEGPKVDWKSPLDAFEDVLTHERKVTKLINELVDLAIAEKDHASNAFLQWFITEQVEEEMNADAIIQQLKLMGDAPGGLFMIDKELALRVYTPPAAAV